MITLITISSFILGYLLCHFAQARVWRKLYDREHEDNKKLINEWSIRTGGRKVFVPEKRVEPDAPKPDTDFRIMTPSMAEDEEEGRLDVIDDLPQMTADDFEHLRETGVLR